MDVDDGNDYKRRVKANTYDFRHYMVRLFLLF